MKPYKFDVVRNGTVETTRSISDGYSFIFVFPTPAFKKANKIGINLYFKDNYTYRGTFTPSSAHGGDLEFRFSYLVENKNGKTQQAWHLVDTSHLRFGQDDVNIVVRVDKSYPAGFMTYVNDEFLQTIDSISLVNNDIGRVDTAGVAIDTPDEVAVTLAVFEYPELEQAKTYASTKRNMDASEDCGENTTTKEHLEEEMETHLGSDGASGPSPLLGPNINPPDAEFMKLSSTIAWPKAVKSVEPIHSDSVRKDHDRLMNDWVVARGDNISSGAYDYLVYSHGVVWPNVIASYFFDAAVLEIRAKHAEIIQILE